MIGEVVRDLEHPAKREGFAKHAGGLIPSREEDLKRMVAPILRATAIGSLLGILPGGEALLSSFAAYMLEKKAFSPC